MSQPSPVDAGRVRRVLDSLFTFVGVLSADGVLLDVNRAPLEAGGLEAAQVLGRPFWDTPWWAYDAGVQARCCSACAQAAAGEVMRFDVPVRMRDDSRMWIDFQVAPLRDDDGSVTHLVASATDISSRRDVEQQLREQLDLVQTLANNATQAVFMMDASGYCTFQNPAAGRMFGFTAAEVGTKPLHDLVHHHHPDGRPFPMADCPIDRALPENFDIREHADVFIRKDGTFVPVLVAASPIFKDGRPVATVIEVRDVTAQRQAQEAERAAARQKDEFIAVLAHELRNPLAPIRTAMGALRVLAPADPALVRCGEVVERQVGHMARLLDDLLDVSRLSRGRLTLQRALAPLDDVLDAALETARPLIDERRHRLRRRGPDVAVIVDGDQARLAQVFANLLNNAARYTPPGGHIDLDVALDGPSVEVRVRDTGAGIAPEQLERIFEMFAQGGDDWQYQGGLGIGLALAKRLVELHDGRLTAASAGVGQGATFTVRLPRLLAAVPEHEHEPAARIAVARRVLVVDDNADIADSAALLLSAAGCAVQTAYGGAEALAQVDAFAPDVVLLDLGMPGIDGFETCRRLRERPEGSALRIVAVTGWGQDDSRRRTAAAGFDAHLVKPVAPEELLQVVAAERATTAAPDDTRPGPVL